MAGRGGTFDGRIRELSRRVGNGPLTGEVVVDQIYAAYQEFEDGLAHPSGGQAHYLETSLYDTTDDNLRGIADEVLDKGPLPAMIDGMERVAGQVARRAPVDLFNLRQSANPRVADQGVYVYDRPPVQRRLTEEELRALRPQRDRPGRG